LRPYDRPVALPTIAVFDLDGTLLDSDEALIDPFVTLGIPRETITFGHPIEIECARLGLNVADYLAAYDTGVAQPFEGASDLVSRLGRWAVCSNKSAWAGRAELARLGWSPEVALFADDFGGAAKELGPVIDLLGARPHDVLFVGDTSHDARAAESVGVMFAWAGWNPRTAAEHPPGRVLAHPLDVLDLLDPP
jgi:HAD superfamily hydrolase (TIGR01549 family)